MERMNRSFIPSFKVSMKRIAVCRAEVVVISLSCREILGTLHNQP